MPANVLTGPRCKIDYERAIILKVQGFNFEQIAEQLGVKAQSLAVGFSKKGITAELAKAKEQRFKDAEQVYNALHSSGNSVRKGLANELEQQVAALAKSPIRKASELATCDGIQGRANTVKALAETAAKVYGWDQAGTGGDTPILMLLMDQGEAIQALDVESSVSSSVPSSTEQALPSTPDTQ